MSSSAHFRKKLAAQMRGGDFTHPGNTDAIELALQYLNTTPDHRILDVGCGLGGTAHYLKSNNYGQPIGFDFDINNIDYAQHKYPDIKFHHCDVVNSNSHFGSQHFDIIWLFNAFSMFNDQKQSLRSLSKLVNHNSKILIFDYIEGQNYSKFNWIPSRAHYPINLARIKQQLTDQGWQITHQIDISVQFKLWYEQDMTNINSQKNQLISSYGLDAYNNLFITYHNFYEMFENQLLGGSLIIATRS